jgi:twitching motility protein PilT
MAAIHAFFDQLLELKGSDLHLAADLPPIYRVHGQLEPFGATPLGQQNLQAMLLEILDEHQREVFLRDRDLDFAIDHGANLRLRANYFWKISGPGAVFRTIPTRVRSLDELGVPSAINRLAERKNGLVLVTGPTGSGKSTTLAAMIDLINRTRACHILTVEDPVEFVHQPKVAQVTHREVGPDASSFASAIRSAGREDADVILIGELRTNETMKLALQLASFGILVFGTLHTNNASSTIDRILNAFPTDEQGQIRGMLAESLAGVVAQQLVRTADGKGRVAAHEILLGSSALASMIREGKTFQIPNLMQGGQAQGMQTMDMSLMRLVENHVISTHAAIEKASDKESFERMLGDRAPTAAP